MTRRLVIRPGAIGDLILSLPAIEFLRARSDYLEVWCAAPNVPLVRFSDHVAPISSTGLDWLGLPGIDPPQSILRALRSFDDIVSWYGASRRDFREAVTGLPFRFFEALPPGGAPMHAADFYLNQVGGAAMAAPRIDCARANGGFAVVHPFSGGPRKNWPLANFRELARRLESRLPVKWCVGPEEDLPDAVRFGDLYELACWLAQARVYIGNDSGITHLAAAVGAPVIAIFQSSDPAVWAPRGARVTVLSSPSLEAVEAACLEQTK